MSQENYIKHPKKIGPRETFQAAYENRYTWNESFTGYQGKCSLLRSGVKYVGDFQVDKDLKFKVLNIKPIDIIKLISQQLFEVTIHRVRRSFEDTHSGNTFEYGDTNERGVELIVSGKNKGDKYRVKDNVITMVYRHIHGKIIRIYTNNVLRTKNGYLGEKYSSITIEPNTGETLNPISNFTDQYKKLTDGNIWVLTKRSISTKEKDSNKIQTLEFEFYDIRSL